MNRRSFLTGILAACAAPLFLPGAGRIWVLEKKVVAISAMPTCFSMPIIEILRYEMGRGRMWENESQFVTASDIFDVFPPGSVIIPRQYEQRRQDVLEV